MAETNKSQMMSEAEIIEAINADSLISVSLGAGQPQKNVKMSTLASVAAGLMPFGFHGILENTNIDDVITPGLYFPTDSCTNAPPAGWWGTPLLVFKTEGYNYFTQVYICSAQSSIYVRHLAYKEQNWSAWTKT